jgi:ComF family protein
VHRLIDIVLPPRCPGCGREGSALCAACRATVGRRLDEPVGTPIGLPSTQPDLLVQLEWCSSFTGPARASIHALKYSGERRLAGPLGELMAARWSRSGIGGEALVPVPVHADRRRERGFDQAELLATVISRHLGLRVQRSVQRAAATQAQHGLGRQARAGNVGRAFVVPERHAATVAGRWLVLIDDVVTTGATLSACAAALHEAGAAAVSALCLARER